MIRDAVEHIRALTKQYHRPWLIVGKGPSLNRRAEFELGHYSIISLNHACRVVPPDMAHFTDLEAYANCALECQEQGTAVVLPWYPHVDMRPSPNNLGKYAQFHDDLEWLIKHGRLYSYNSTVASRLPKNLQLPTIRVRYFSAVAAVNLLLAADVKLIRTLGIDGGKHYAKGFDPEDLLANGRPSFDVQFDEIHKACRKHGATYAPLTEKLK